MSDLSADVKWKPPDVSIEWLTKTIQLLCHRVDESYVQIGVLLLEVQRRDLYRPKYETIDDYVEGTTGFGWRKGRHLIRIAGACERCGIPTAQMARLPWTTAREIAPILKPDNWQAVIDKVQTIPTDEVADFVADAQGLGIEKAVAQATRGWRTYRLQVPDDAVEMVEQGFTKAERLAKSKHRGHLFVLIMADFLAGPDELEARHGEGV